MEDQQNNVSASCSSPTSLCTAISLQPIHNTPKTPPPPIPPALTPTNTNSPLQKPSAFNTIQPALQRDKMVYMGVDHHLSNWILDYLTDRPQYVMTLDCKSDMVVCNTVAPQGTVLALFLFTVYTADFLFISATCHLQKFSDDSAIIGLITDDDAREYRGLIQNFVELELPPDKREERPKNWWWISETKWKGSKARNIGGGFKLFYYGVNGKRNGVGVILKEDYSKSVVEVKRVSDKVMNLKLEVEGMMINVISAYTPQVGCEMEEKEKFWSELDEVVDGVSRNERLLIGADFNGHVGEGNRGDEEVMGRYGLMERNVEGQMVVDFAKRMEMAVVNIYFKKKEDHRVTYKSGGRCRQVDYVLCMRCNLKKIGDCKVLAGDSVARQHRMVVCRMVLETKKKRRRVRTDRRIRWWKLKEEECSVRFREEVRQGLGGVKEVLDVCGTTAGVMRETDRKVLGVTSGNRKEDKEMWWWYEEVQESIMEKRLTKQKWDRQGDEKSRQEYKEMRQQVKRDGAKATEKAYEELYERLNTKEGEKDLYRLSRQRDRAGKDVLQVRAIKNEDGNVLTSEESVLRSRREYFEQLMNEENKRERRLDDVELVKQEVDRISKEKVRAAIKRIKSGKSVGPDDIPVEAWRCLGEMAVKFLTRLFNKILEEKFPHCGMNKDAGMGKAEDKDEEVHYETITIVELDHELRDKIVARHRSGEGYKNRCCTEDSQKHTGLHNSQTAKLGNQGIMALIKEVTKNSMVILTMVIQWRFRVEIGQSSRRSTIPAAIYRSGLNGRVARQKPLLIAKPMEVCLEFKGTQRAQVSASLRYHSWAHEQGPQTKTLHHQESPAASGLPEKAEESSSPSPILTMFYRGTIETILKSCITAWFGNCTVSDRKTLQRIVRTAEKII
ncbi:gastrula zinc finger protein XlCGF28.1-like [Silurus meridionalis]|nr:gastrula zinc finger protein XlCGF28.1-like [Silurus meridionalis]